MGLLNDLENSPTEKFSKIYSAIARTGAKELYDELLLGSDFFTAPASSKFHLCREGGLCEHSVNVYNELKRLLSIYPEFNHYSEETLAIVSLLHDVCKINNYVVSTRNKKVDNQWVQVPYYEFKEQFAYGGHGAKSVYLIQKYMKLTDEEAVAIHCHMGYCDRPNNDFSIASAYEQFPLAWFVHAADEAATHLMEKDTHE